MKSVARLGHGTTVMSCFALIVTVTLCTLIPVKGLAAPPAATPLIELGAGDLLRLQVVGRPEMSSLLYVADDGSIPVPMAGTVAVAGLSPAAASARVAGALRQARILIDPQVSLVVEQVRSQRISVVGQVRSPGRFAVESRLSVLDALAQAGGTTELAADVIHVLRTGADGTAQRLSVDLADISSAAPGRATVLRAGDTIVVPQAAQFYIYGEVRAPNMYRIERGMTVLQAISRSGGLTPRGSDSRIEIERKSANNATQTISARLSDRVQPDDVIRVKERFF